MNFLPFTRGGRAQGAASSASEGSRVASRSGSRALGAAAASFAMVAASLGPIASVRRLLMLATMTVRRVSARLRAAGRLSRIIRVARAARTGCTPLR